MTSDAEDKSVRGTNNRLRSLSGVEYHGVAGASAHCKEAVINIFQLGRNLERAYVLTAGNSHALFLIDEIGDQIAIKSGFGSGYGGAGPRAFSFILALLYESRVEIDEILVDAALIERLDYSALSNRDVKHITENRPIRPSRWADYIFEEDLADATSGKLWNRFPAVMPFAIIDPRIMDLARDFRLNPDDAIITGYRRLEDVVRKRTGANDHGTKLFSSVFLSDKRRLTWKIDDEGEQKGRATLFTAAFMAFRNPRAHQEQSSNMVELLSEFLVLNQLFRLEALAASEIAGSTTEGSTADDRPNS